MLEGNQTLYHEILAILLAEMECAESLEATTREIQHLMDHDQYEQMRDRLNARGEVFDMMISLDRQMRTLVEKRVQGTDIDEWQAIKKIGEQVRNLMITIMQMDAITEEMLQQKKENVKSELNKLIAGKKGVKGYTQAHNQEHVVQVKG